MSYTFRGVKWHRLVPAEHFQPPDVLEILTTRIEGLGYGEAVTLVLDDEQLEIRRG